MVAFPCQPSPFSNANILTLPRSECVHECFCPGTDRSGWFQDAELAASFVAAVSRTQLSAAIFPPICPVRPANESRTAHSARGRRRRGRRDLQGPQLSLLNQGSVARGDALDVSSRCWTPASASCLVAGGRVCPEAAGSNPSF